MPKKKKISTSKKEKIVNLLKSKIPNAYEKMPRGDMHPGRLEAIVEEILKLV